MIPANMREIKPGFLIPQMKPIAEAQQAAHEKKDSDSVPAETKEEKTTDFECACFTCPSQEECKAAQEAEKTMPAEPIDFSKVEIEPLFSDFVDFETFSKSDFRAVKVLECEAVPKSKKLLKFHSGRWFRRAAHHPERHPSVLRA